MKAPFRYLILVLLVVGARTNAPVSAQTTGCQPPEQQARRRALPRVEENKVRDAEAILRHWSGDSPPITREQFDAEEFHVLGLLHRLQDTLGGSLAATLLNIMARPFSTSPFRMTSLQSAAAHFFVGAGLPDTSLEQILLSPDFELDNRLSVYWALTWRDLPLRQVSHARLQFVCQLARQVVTASPDSVMSKRDRLRVVFRSLDHERDLTSRAAAALLGDPEIRSAMAQLQALDSLPSSQDPTR